MVFVCDANKETQWRAFLKRSQLTDCDMPFSQVVHELWQKLKPVVNHLQQ